MERRENNNKFKIKLSNGSSSTCLRKCRIWSHVDETIDSVERIAKVSLTKTPLCQPPPPKKGQFMREVFEIYQLNKCPLECPKMPTGVKG